MYDITNTDFYTCRNKQVGVLVHKSTQRVLASYNGEIVMKIASGITRPAARMVREAHLQRAWYEFDYSEVVAMKRLVGQVRPPVTFSIDTL